jgi:HAD superfamily hydrolase (TIGR01458 family)
MDGVLYNDSTPIEGAAEVLRWVRAAGIPHLFVTNTSARTREALAEKLAGFGIEAVAADLMTPPVAAAQWLQGRPESIALFAPSEVRAEFAGLPLLDDRAETGAGFVVVGDLGRAWTFDVLNRAFRLLQSNPAQLMALGFTRCWQAPDGLRLDVAPFVAALECAAGCRAKVFGKPSPEFFESAVRRLGVEPPAAIMIGDDIETDVGGAQQAGLRGVLVRTGKFRPRDLDGRIKPDAVLDSIADLPAWWRSSGEAI